MTEIIDITPKLREYLLDTDSISEIVENRIYAGEIPLDKVGDAKQVSKPKVSFRQNGGDPKGMNYRYTFVCRCDSLKEARELAILIANRLTKDNFSLESDDGENLSYWAEIEGSLLDSTDEVTGLPEVFFNVNFEALQ